jgi:hypothetical protein
MTRPSRERSNQRNYKTAYNRYLPVVLDGKSMPHEAEEADGITENRTVVTGDKEVKTQSRLTEGSDNNRY